MNARRPTPTLSAMLAASLAVIAAPTAAEADPSRPAPAPTGAVSWTDLGGVRPPKPPRGYGLSGVPAGYYGPPLSPGVLPKASWEEPGPVMVRDRKTAAIGGGIMGAGFVTLIAGVLLQLNNTECETVAYLLPSCRQVDPGVDAAAKGMMITGPIVLLAVGLPVMLIGLRKRPASELSASFVGHPTPNGWGWRF